MRLKIQSTLKFGGSRVLRKRTDGGTGLLYPHAMRSDPEQAIDHARDLSSGIPFAPEPTAAHACDVRVVGGAVNGLGNARELADRGALLPANTRRLRRGV